MKSVSTDRKRVLVFPCGSEIGLEIHAALRYEKSVELVGLSSLASNHGKFVFANYVDGFPFVDDPRFVSELRKFIEARNIDFIFPAHDSVVLKLAEEQMSLPAKVIGSSADTAAVCRSKGRTYQTFRDLLRVPKVFSSVGDSFDSQEQVFLKPDVGQGSKGCCLSRLAAHAEALLESDPSLLLLEYLPGREYTIDCLCGSEGELLYVGPRERLRTANGICTHTRRVDDPRFNEMAQVIAGRLRFHGPMFFQAKEASNGELALLEVAPRIAGTMGYQRSLGVNIPLISLWLAQGHEVKVEPAEHSVEMDRALVNRFHFGLQYNTVYVDFDDTLIVNGRLNTQLIAFLYQCISNEKKLVLLSKHSGNLAAALKRWRLDGLFDEVVHLKTTDSKGQWMRSRSGPALFVDDSFREREGVRELDGVVTFGTDAVECLLEEKR